MAERLGPDSKRAATLRAPLLASSGSSGPSVFAKSSELCLARFILHPRRLMLAVNPFHVSDSTLSLSFSAKPLKWVPWGSCWPRPPSASNNVLLWLRANDLASHPQPASRPARSPAVHGYPDGLASHPAHPAALLPPPKKPCGCPYACLCLVESRADGPLWQHYVGLFASSNKRRLRPAPRSAIGLRTPIRLSMHSTIRYLRKTILCPVRLSSSPRSLKLSAPIDEAPSVATDHLCGLQISQAPVSWSQTWSPRSMPLSYSACEASEDPTRCPCRNATPISDAARDLGHGCGGHALDAQTEEPAAAPAGHLVAQVMVECALGSVSRRGVVCRVFLLQPLRPLAPSGRASTRLGPHPRPTGNRSDKPKTTSAQEPACPRRLLDPLLLPTEMNNEDQNLCQLCMMC
ncbi:hypothetical protein PTTG_07993 [Puccinia triticina 1-1 BBBD Race 1]|uniref:Uncharacterized protein n=2 Tax=Puccinia triticina TaxID=208348 RepID=A0A180H5X0_PUCT1|nr:hypothetical protein PTTG_07993 [Puccinia triticina 1-1 BBBD Race 1]